MTQMSWIPDWTKEQWEEARHWATRYNGSLQGGYSARSMVAHVLDLQRTILQEPAHPLDWGDYGRCEYAVSLAPTFVQEFLAPRMSMYREEIERREREHKEWEQSAEGQAWIAQRARRLEEDW